MTINKKALKESFGDTFQMLGFLGLVVMAITVPLMLSEAVLGTPMPGFAFDVLAFYFLLNYYENVNKLKELENKNPTTGTGVYTVPIQPERRSIYVQIVGGSGSGGSKSKIKKYRKKNKK